jgi:hypothetical protein
MPVTFEATLRVTEVIMALAFLQQSAEHFAVGSRQDRWLFGGRVVACLGLLSGVFTGGFLIVLCAISLRMLVRFGGPYNGGSDKMSLLILWCLTAAYLLPVRLWQETALAYLGVQVTLSYFISGQIKIVNPAWRSGQALVDVFAFSAYPVSEGLRRLADHKRLMFLMSWAVMLFEVAFPLALLNSTVLIVALVIGASFHLANACLFGLNRFFWIWLAAYPALIWFQGRLPSFFG